MKNKRRLGEILVKSGLLTEEKLEQALESKKKTDLKLGQYLIRQGLVQEKQIIDLISDQLNIRKYQLNDFPLDLELIRYIPIEIAQKNQVVPLKLKGKLLTIAIVDPLDIQILDSLEKLTNLEVEPVICSEVEINQLINSMYGMQSDLGILWEPWK
jgi:type IV pilus assembly protein PilB